MEQDIYKELSGTRVLIVDDEKDFAEMCKEYLEGVGIDVVGVANNGTDALEMTENLDPALVILDIRMPGMDGIEVASRIMASGPRPIMFLSAHSEGDYIERARQTGVFTYLIKTKMLDGLLPAIVLTLDHFKELISLKAEMDDLRESIANKSIIEKAKQMVGDRYMIAPNEAYERIRARSRDNNKPMADIARAIVNSGGEL